MNLSQATESAKIAIKARLPIMVEGSPGVGKSDMFKKIAETYKLELVDIRVSQCDITDFNGLPFIDNGKARFNPFDIFPLENTPLPEGKNGWLLFLDEMNAAMPSVQVAAYKLILDRMVGNYHLHPKVAICCAGNKITDNAVVNELSTALRSRLINIEVEVDFDTWFTWAANNEIDGKILAFLMHDSKFLFNFDPEKEDKTFACPRTWEMLSKVLKFITDVSTPDKRELINGIIGNKAGTEFVTYCKYCYKLPKFEDILNGSYSSTAGEEVGVIYQIIGEIVSNYKKITTETQLVNCCETVKKFGSEWLVVLANKFYTIGANTIFIKFPKYLQYAQQATKENSFYDLNGR